MLQERCLITSYLNDGITLRNISNFLSLSSYDYYIVVEREFQRYWRLILSKSISNNRSSRSLARATSSADAAQLLYTYLKHYRHYRCPALFTAQQPIAGSISRLSYRTVHQNWRKLIAGIPELEGARLHDLRHTFATERVGLMGIEELRALMGHESIMTTLRYQKVTSARAETVAQSALKKLATGAIET